ncbi:transmembrane protein 243 isoform X1 [Panthera uncia]|uniref:transmembrane protein 243 isoform X1 n=1 Tax=Panthera uncia TaxID=29064 RepID=UPI00042B99B7|nr:transmembrane protein 243 isoform X1 [Panthera uncia]
MCQAQREAGPWCLNSKSPQWLALYLSESGSITGLNSYFLFQDRIINLVVGSLTSLLILVTLISAFVFPQLPPKPLNIFFAVCISLSSITACILIYWYRQGDLEPKFRNLIYYILFSIIMLCICANLYFHDVGK